MSFSVWQVVSNEQKLPKIRVLLLLASFFSSIAKTLSGANLVAGCGVEEELPQIFITARMVLAQRVLYVSRRKSGHPFRQSTAPFMQ
jgi:hypothetical protein